MSAVLLHGRVEDIVYSRVKCPRVFTHRYDYVTMSGDQFVFEKSSYCPCIVKVVSRSIRICMEQFCDIFSLFLKTFYAFKTTRIVTIAALQFLSTYVPSPCERVSWSGARFSKFPKCFRASESCSKISKLITELFYSPILNMNRSSLHTRSVRCKHLSVFRYRLTKNGFAGHKSFRGFRETGLGRWLANHLRTHRTRLSNNCRLWSSSTLIRGEQQ